MAAVLSRIRETSTAHVEQVQADLDFLEERLALGSEGGLTVRLSGLRRLSRAAAFARSLVSAVVEAAAVLPREAVADAVLARVGHAVGGDYALCR